MWDNHFTASRVYLICVRVVNHIKSNEKMGNANQKPSSTPPSPQSPTTTTIDLCTLLAELQCSVCLNLFNEPMSLPCGHINCASCVQGVIDAATEPVLSINCPQCRAELQVPANGQFPTAFVVKNLVTLINIKQPIVASKKRIASIRLENVVSVAAESIWMRIWLALFSNPDKALCCEANTGEGTRIRLDQLDTFLNEQVEGAVHRVSFYRVQFDEPMVQMLRRIKRERFEDVDRDFLSIAWENCDFSRISEASFRFLLGEMFWPDRIYISDWTGLPTGFDYNALFQLKAFRDAWCIRYNVGYDIKPNSPTFNLHLNSDVLIDFLHKPVPEYEYRRLELVDAQLHDGFDSFLDRLIERFHQDTERRHYELILLVLNATKETKERLKLDEPQILEHPEGEDMDTLKLKWRNVPDYNIDNLFEFRAEREYSGYDTD